MRTQSHRIVDTDPKRGNVVVRVTGTHHDEPTYQVRQSLPNTQEVPGHNHHTNRVRETGSGSHGPILRSVPTNRLSQHLDRSSGSRHGFVPSDTLKFNNSTRPQGMKREDWNSAKGEVIEASKVANARFMAVLIHHRIAAGKKDKLFNWQLNKLLDEFHDNYLTWTHDDVGIVFLDRVGQGAEYNLTKEMFAPDPASSRHSYPRILGYAATCNGSSHIASAADIVLGSFGYCVNQRGDLDVTKRLMRAVWPLIWHPEQSDVWGDGILLVPWNVTFRPYQADYRALFKHVNRLVDGE